MSLWTSADIVAATKGTCPGTFAATGVAIDSRAVAAGDLFVALVGPNHDAHAYVAQALEAGAAAALVHRPVDGADANRLVTATDTFVALQDLGRAGRDRFAGRVVGVTGSVGKTSTKEMLALALSPFGAVHAAVGSFNNHWGVPLTLARMPQDAAHAVIEMGMNHAGELTALTALARPDVALITAIAPAHMEFFASTAAIADAKAEIFSGVQPGGTAILPRDSEHFERLAGHARDHGLTVLTFGAHAEADAHLIDAAIDGDRTTVFARIGETTLTFGIGAAGRHWAINALAVLAAARALGLDVKTAAAALGRLEPPKGRGRRAVVRLPGSGGTITVIDDAYNANPASVAAALAVLGQAKPGKEGRRVAVLGDMLELGAAAPAMHAGLAQEVLAQGIARVYTAGPLMAHLHDALPERLRGAHAEDGAALLAALTQDLRPGDVVMVKGSAGSRMGRIVTALLDLDAKD